MDKLSVKKVLLVLGILAFAALASSSPVTMSNLDNAIAPDVNVSAVRRIVCDRWTGSGFLIGDKIMATARHVMNGGTGCVDEETGAKLTVYKEDKAHDLVLVTGNLPINMPYIRLSCDGYKTGETYMSYGISNYGYNREIVRSSFATATKEYTDGNFLVGNINEVWPGMRYLKGRGVPGMSGGMWVNQNGYAVGMINVGGMFIGLPLNEQYSYEFKGGMLCQPQSQPQPNSSIPSSSVN